MTREKKGFVTRSKTHISLPFLDLDGSSQRVKWTLGHPFYPFYKDVISTPLTSVFYDDTNQSSSLPNLRLRIRSHGVMTYVEGDGVTGRYVRERKWTSRGYERRSLITLSSSLSLPSHLLTRDHTLVRRDPGE